MSQENVEAFKRAIEAGNQRDIEAPSAFVVEFKNGKAVSVRAFFDHKEALEAVGLRE